MHTGEKNLGLNAHAFLSRLVLSPLLQVAEVSEYPYNPDMPVGRRRLRGWSSALRSGPAQEILPACTVRPLAEIGKCSPSLANSFRILFSQVLWI